MSITETRASTEPPAADHPDGETDRPVDGSAAGQGPTVTEMIVTATAGMAIGTAAVWFLAPFCLTC